MTERNGTNRPAATGREKAYLALIAAVLVILAAMLILYPYTRRDAVEASSGSAATDAAGEPERAVRERWIEVEKTITAEVIEDRLQEMGVLLTAEYYFTDLISFSSVKTFLKTELALPFTETSYMVRYDGVVSAGIDLSAARIEKDDDLKRVTVLVPAASIRSTTIDLDSFELIEEKTGFGNPLSVQDFNDSLRAFEESAERKAVERGLLEKADRNAKTVIAQFIGGVVGGTEYVLQFETVEGGEG